MNNADVVNSKTSNVANVVFHYSCARKNTHKLLNTYTNAPWIITKKCNNAPVNVPVNAPVNVPANVPVNAPDNAPDNVHDNVPDNVPVNVPDNVLPSPEKILIVYTPR